MVSCAAKFLTILTLTCCLELSAQVAGFDIWNENQVCLGEELSFSNSSVNSDSYLWDFCFAEFDTVGVLRSSTISVASLNYPEGIEVVYDSGNWYGFIGDRSVGSLYLLDYGSDLNSEPAVSEVLVTGDLWGSYKDIRFVEQSGRWYGFVTSYSQSTLYRLDFGTALGDTATSVSLGNLGGWNTLRGMSLVEDGNDVVLAISSSNTNQLSLVRFEGSVLSSPTVLAVSDIDNLIFSPRGVSIIQVGNEWYGLLASFSNDKLLLLDFGSSLFSDPEVVEIGFVDSPTGVRLVRNGFNYYGLVLSRDSGLFIYDFGSVPSSLPDIERSLGNYSGVLDEGFALSVVRDFSDWHVKGMNLSGAVISIDFTKNSFYSSVLSSTSFEPTGLSYDNAGSYLVELTAIHANGSIDRVLDTITVLDQIAPDISFTTVNECVSSLNTFTVQNTSGGITSYSWDFDGDRVEDSDEESPTYMFPSAGTYTVRLTVDDGTCGNFTEQEITIYEEPPLPDFETSGLLCGSQELAFTNLTPEGSYPGSMEYSWNFDGIGTSEERDPSFNFGSGGMKTVTLTAGIPGCYNQVQYVIDLEPGPTSLFQASSVCQGEAMSFTNQSSNAVSYLWDFGDGFTSTEISPTHVFTDGGNFIVALTSTDGGGCTNVVEQEVAIPYAPVVDFDFEVPCTGGEGHLFRDLSQVTGADILSWQWSVDDQVITSEQSPLIAFDEGGTKTIRLDVISSNGCSGFIEQEVAILEGPEVSFTSEIQCETLPSTFTDNTPGQSGVVSRIWNIAGQTYAGGSVIHTFDEAGQFDVTLTLTSSNFCENVITSSVTIPESPELDFELSGVCAGDAIVLTDISLAGDPVVSRTWSLDGEVLNNGLQGLIEEAEEGVHTIRLDVVTALGCELSLERQEAFFTAPISGFSASSTYGVPPFSVQFTNLSSDTQDNVWFVNDVEVSTATDLVQTFTEEGIFTITLQATNPTGCEAIHTAEVISALPTMDVVVDDFTLTPIQHSQAVNLTLTNKGNLPIEIFEVTVTAGTDFSITERFNAFLGINEQTSVQLSSTLQLINSQLVCVSVSSAYEDVSPLDNEVCINLTQAPILETVHPNPIGDEVSVRVTLATSQALKIQIANTTGALMIDQEYASLDEGLHVLTFDSSLWEKGLYFISIIYGENRDTRKVVRF